MVIVEKTKEMNHKKFPRQKLNSPTVTAQDLLYSIYWKKKIKSLTV